MAEAAIFIIVVGALVIVLFSVFDLYWIDPRVVISILALLILPGMYAAFTSGPFVPSARKRHKTMLKLADLSDSDTVYDLGCGDGRLVFSASKLAKKAIGYDLSIPLVLYGKLLSLFYPRASIRFGNIWKQDYSDATVIFCYLLPGAMKQFHKEVWPKLKPGTRVISNGFAIHQINPHEVEEGVYRYMK
ncbi:MAG: class I SAM-dependent methyltransferase [Candidatus Peregrinibacteria bacterium]|nr:class I SAM-dependent methyltransferase [Candidatus Peregrinibacteria bacterium]